MAEARRTARCVRCGRKLTDPTSVGVGIGTTCAAKLRAAAALAHAASPLAAGGAQVLDASWGAPEGVRAGG